MPFDFIACDQGRTSFVRVRRLRYAGYEVADIGFSCRDDIAALRAMPVLPGISLQLHVRGPDRHWHRYLVLPDEIIEAGEPEQVSCSPDHDRMAAGQARDSTIH